MIGNYDVTVCTCSAIGEGTTARDTHPQCPVTMEAARLRGVGDWDMAMRLMDRHFAHRLALHRRLKLEMEGRGAQVDRMANATQFEAGLEDVLTLPVVDAAGSRAATPEPRRPGFVVRLDPLFGGFVQATGDETSWCPSDRNRALWFQVVNWDGPVGSVTWMSSDSMVATVAPNGMVIACRVGTCTITAMADVGGKHLVATHKLTIDVPRNGVGYIPTEAIHWRLLGVAPPDTTWTQANAHSAEVTKVTTLDMRATMSDPSASIADRVHAAVDLARAAAQGRPLDLRPSDVQAAERAKEAEAQYPDPVVGDALAGWTHTAGITFEEVLEDAFWKYDRERAKDAGHDRDAFKGVLRAFARRLAHDVREPFDQVTRDQRARAEDGAERGEFSIVDMIADWSDDDIAESGQVRALAASALRPWVLRTFDDKEEDVERVLDQAVDDVMSELWLEGGWCLVKKSVVTERTAMLKTAEREAARLADLANKERSDAEEELWGIGQILDAHADVPAGDKVAPRVMQLTKQWLAAKRLLEAQTTRAEVAEGALRKQQAMIENLREELDNLSKELDAARAASDEALTRDEYVYQVEPKSLCEDVVFMTNHGRSVLLDGVTMRRLGIQIQVKGDPIGRRGGAIVQECDVGGCDLAARFCGGHAPAVDVATLDARGCAQTGLVATPAGGSFVWNYDPPGVVAKADPEGLGVTHAMSAFDERLSQMELRDRQLERELEVASERVSHLEAAVDGDEPGDDGLCGMFVRFDTLKLKADRSAEEIDRVREVVRRLESGLEVVANNAVTAHKRADIVREELDGQPHGDVGLLEQVRRLVEDQRGTRGAIVNQDAQLAALENGQRRLERELAAKEHVAADRETLVGKARIVLVGPNGKVPVRKYERSAGADCYAANTVDRQVPVGGRWRVPLGFKVEIPPNLFGLVVGRSGGFEHEGIIVHPGVVDSDYRGEVHALFMNQGREAITIRPGERIAQILFLPVALLGLEVVGALSDTERGERGFGSTGTK